MTWLTRDAHAGVGQIHTTGTIDERYRQYRVSGNMKTTQWHIFDYLGLMIISTNLYPEVFNI